MYGNITTRSLLSPEKRASLPSCLDIVQKSVLLLALIGCFGVYLGTFLLCCWGCFCARKSYRISFVGVQDPGSSTYAVAEPCITPNVCPRNGMEATVFATQLRAWCMPCYLMSWATLVMLLQ